MSLPYKAILSLHDSVTLELAWFSVHDCFWGRVKAYHGIYVYDKLMKL